MQQDRSKQRHTQSRSVHRNKRGQHEPDSSDMCVCCTGLGGGDFGGGYSCGGGGGSGLETCGCKALSITPTTFNK